MQHRFTFSAHARIRLAQRGISHELVAFLLKHGRKERADGAWIYHFPRRAKRSLLRGLSVELREKLAKFPYLVAENGRLITAGYRYKRIKRNARAHKPRARGKLH